MAAETVELHKLKVPAERPTELGEGRESRPVLARVAVGPGLPPACAPTSVSREGPPPPAVTPPARVLLSLSWQPLSRRCPPRGGGGGGCGGVPGDASALRGTAAVLRLPGLAPDRRQGAILLRG